MASAQQHGLRRTVRLAGVSILLCVGQALAFAPERLMNRRSALLGQEVVMRGANNSDNNGPPPNDMTNMRAEDMTTNNQRKRQSTMRPGSMVEAIADLGRVPYGEESRRFRRTVYTSQADWIVHRSSFSIVENLKGGLFSGIIRRLKEDVMLVTAMAVFVVLWNGLIGNDHESFLFQENLVFLPHLALPFQPFTLSSPALALLLVFRTNTSYSRWLDARKKWAAIQTHTINLARMAATFTDVSNQKSAEALDRLMRTIWALPRCLMNRFSGPEDEAGFEDELMRAFGDDTSSPLLENVMTAQDRPMAALIELSFALSALPLDPKTCLEMDKSIIILGECVASCERIYTSPVPLVYTRHTGRFLSLWMILLPFPLYDLFVEPDSILTEQVFLESIVLIPAAAVLAIFLFGIQELSLQLEEPFSILPMQKFCDDIRTTTISMKNRAIQESSLKAST